MSYIQITLFQDKATNKFYMRSQELAYCSVVFQWKSVSQSLKEFSLGYQATKLSLKPLYVALSSGNTFRTFYDLLNARDLGPQGFKYFPATLNLYSAI